MRLVKDYMNRNVVYFKPEDSVFDAAKVFSQKNISGAPVVDRGRLIGIISETDIVKFMRLKLPEGETLVQEPHILTLLVVNLLKDRIKFKKDLRNMLKINVKDLMSTDVVSITPAESLIDAATKMEKNDIRRLIVVEEGKLVGIISKADLIKALIMD